jgi:hypothetical protein
LYSHCSKSLPLLPFLFFARSLEIFPLSLPFVVI